MNRTLLFSAIVVVVAIVYFYLIGPFSSTLLPKKKGWWGRTGTFDEKADQDTAIFNFTLNVPTVVMHDLSQRLKRTRFKEDLENPKTFVYGLRTDTMRAIVDHWLDNYQWNVYEDELKKFPQYKTRIEGLYVHFLRVLPEVEPHHKVLPLLLIHGWPSSVWEFYKIIPMLAAHTEDNSDNIAFEVICPSIPGYGFSEEPHQEGFDVMDVARIFVTLMRRLGHRRFYVQGGDWGSIIATYMAKAYSRNIIGIHLNLFFPPLFSFKSAVKQIVGMAFPTWLDITDAEYARLFPFRNRFNEFLQEMGYAHIQATKPDTIGISLNDSPVGLAAYILEKFSSWTDPECRGQPDGCLLTGNLTFTLDDLLTNVMIYWVTETITSSMRLYTTASNPDFLAWDSVAVTVPCGLASFPNELVSTPLTLAAELYKNVVQFTRMSRGGHFAAFEEPELLALDIRNFATKVEAVSQEKPKAKTKGSAKDKSKTSSTKPPPKAPK